MCIKTEGPFNNCIVKWLGGGQTNDYTVFILQMNSEDLSTVLWTVLQAIKILDEKFFQLH